MPEQAYIEQLAEETRGLSPDSINLLSLCVGINPFDTSVSNTELNSRLEMAATRRHALMNTEEWDQSALARHIQNTWKEFETIVYGNLPKRIETAFNALDSALSSPKHNVGYAQSTGIPTGPGFLHRVERRYMEERGKQQDPEESAGMDINSWFANF